jgi:hypothetical protein
MYQAQSSFTVCGPDNTRWIAYNLEDTGFNPDREIGNDERDNYGWRDQISKGKFDVNVPLTDAQDYYLAISLIKAKHAPNEIQRVIERIVASFRNHMTSCLFLAISATEHSAMSKWNEAMLELLAMLIQDLDEKVDCRDSFQRWDLDYFNDPNATLPPHVFEHIVNNSIELQNVYEELRAYGKKLACHLDYRLSLQGSKIGEFTISIVSLIVIVSIIFAAPSLVLPYERSGLSFFLSVAAVALLLWFLILLKGSWFD